MADVPSDEYVEYLFPDLGLNDFDGNLNDLIIKNVSSLIGQDNTNKQQDAQPSQQQDAEITRQKEEIEKLKNEYEAKIVLINSLLAKLENPLAEIDKEIVEMLRLVIKKTVKKLIYKEIKTDKTLMNKVIAELEDLIQSKNGMVTIYLSEADYKRINQEKIPAVKNIKVDTSLNVGDVIVNSNTTEIRAILNERINQLIGEVNA